MKPIEKVRSLFMPAKGQESRLTELLGAVLEALDERKQGT